MTLQKFVRQNIKTPHLLFYSGVELIKSDRCDEKIYYPLHPLLEKLCKKIHLRCLKMSINVMIFPLEVFQYEHYPL